MKIAIVGSNGFIGGCLTEYIAKNTEHQLFLFGKSIQNKFPNLPYYQIQLINDNELKLLFSNIDFIYYLASSTIPSSSWENPILEVENNLIPFLNFTEKIANCQIKKIIFVSSAGTIYGATEQKVKEDFNKRPFSPYGIMKLTIEHFLYYYKIKSNLNYDIYRISNVYGNGQDTKKGLGIINTFLESILLSKKVNVFGDGNNVRNYIFINDVVKLLLHSIETDYLKSNIYNLSSNDTISVNELIDVIKTVINIDFEIEHTKSRKSDNSIIDIDNSKLLNEVSDFKFTSLHQGLLETYTAIKQNLLKNN
ncbi:MAG: NAD-dependent epimerase/dehydratase family protein [Bacteroidia bacterium]|nr:NAD-dependent epimerase/dehydratase family protein [Bacteroidia bacterium]